MRMIPSKVLVSAVSALIVAGCSVKEYRGGCPCRLLLDFSEVDTSVIRSADLLLTAQDDVVFADEVGIADSEGIVRVDVPRAELNMNIYSGASREPVSGEGIEIPFGRQAPPLYLYSSEVDSRSEWTSRKIVMRKEHCLLSVQVVEKDDFPFSLEIVGNVDGYDAYGNPAWGDFLCSMDGDADKGFCAVLPRQLDSSLKLNLCDGTQVAKTFALGDYLESIGYDWTKDNLDDVTLLLDYCLTYVSISVRGWDEEYTYNVVI